MATLSLGVPVGQWSQSLEQAARNLITHYNVTVIVASGNSEEDSCYIAPGEISGLSAKGHSNQGIRGASSSRTCVLILCYSAWTGYLQRVAELLQALLERHCLVGRFRQVLQLLRGWAAHIAVWPSLSCSDCLVRPSRAAKQSPDGSFVCTMEFSLIAAKVAPWYHAVRVPFSACHPLKMLHA